MTNEIDTHPPKWPLKFLRLFIKKSYIEEIEGDLEEIFRDNIEVMSVGRARRIYVWESLKLLRPILLRNFKILKYFDRFGMLNNYFKVSVRGLLKNPLSSSINIIGLAAAIGVCVFAYAFTRWTYSTDQFHEHKNEVFLLTFFSNRDGLEQQFGRSPRPLGEMLRNDFPKIKKICRVEDRNVVVKHEDNVYHERVRFTDAEFLEVFTFPLKWGTSGSLRDVNSIILSQDMSVKYFGYENPIGQSILVKFNQEPGKEFKITGVAQEFPKATSIEFDFLINIENFRVVEPGFNFYDWNAFVNATLIQVNNPADIKLIERGMEKYRVIQNKSVDEDWSINAFAFEPLATLHERSEVIRDDISRSSRDNYSSVVYMTIVATFLLALACINYVNIAIVSAAKRLKEIGVRKSIGATRGVVITQFLSENIVITFFAMLFGLILGFTFFIPGFEGLWHFSMGIKITDATLWIFLPAILLITGIASGAYPAFYISKFQAVGILKGSVKFGKKNPLTKIFLGIQLVFACIFITSAVMFDQNTKYMSKRSWGYNQHEALYAAVPDQLAFEQLEAKMNEIGDVISISGSANHLGKNHAIKILHFPNRQYEADQFAVDAHYFETMGLQLTKGRNFHDHDGSDKQAVIINELLVKTLAFQNPIGQQFEMDSVQYYVVGVVKDFHSYSFFRPMRPTIFTVSPKAAYRFLSVRARHGSEVETYKSLQANWAVLFPEVPFNGGYQEDVWGSYYKQLDIHSLVWRVIALIAIVLASLGLYGLITLNVEGRTREFSIRKVLGARFKELTTQISRQYVILFTLAIIVGAPAGYALVGALLEMAYTYHMPIDFSGAAIAVIIMIFILVITISTQIRKVLKSNPVDGLKVE